MTAFFGKLKGDNGSADCEVYIGADRVPSVRNVRPRLPDGEYRLSVNMLDLKCKIANGECHLITE
jgi:hypothetical protein